MQLSSTYSYIPRAKVSPTNMYWERSLPHDKMQIWSTINGRYTVTHVLIAQCRWPLCWNQPCGGGTAISMSTAHIHAFIKYHQNSWNSSLTHLTRGDVANWLPRDVLFYSFNFHSWTIPWQKIGFDTSKLRKMTTELHPDNMALSVSLGIQQTILVWWSTFLQ